MDHAMLVLVYFTFNLSYQEILGILTSNHGVIILLRKLKPILQQQRLFIMSNNLKVATFIWDQKKIYWVTVVTDCGNGQVASFTTEMFPEHVVLYQNYRNLSDMVGLV